MAFALLRHRLIILKDCERMPIRYCLMAAGLLFLTFFMSLSVHADAATDARNAIKAIYAKIEAGVIKGDLQPLVVAMAPDYVQVNRTGEEQRRMTPEQKRKWVLMVKHLAQHARIDIKSEKITIRHFHLLGNTVTATMQCRAEFTMTDLKTHKTSINKASSISEMVWVRSGNTWLIKRQRIIKNEIIFPHIGKTLEERFDAATL